MKRSAEGVAGNVEENRPHLQAMQASPPTRCHCDTRLSAKPGGMTATLPDGTDQVADVAVAGGMGSLMTMATTHNTERMSGHVKEQNQPHLLVGKESSGTIMLHFVTPDSLHFGVPCLRQLSNAKKMFARYGDGPTNPGVAASNSGEVYYTLRVTAGRNFPTCATKAEPV